MPETSVLSSVVKTIYNLIYTSVTFKNNQPDQVIKLTKQLCTVLNLYKIFEINLL